MTEPTDPADVRLSLPHAQILTQALASATFPPIQGAQAILAIAEALSALQAETVKALAAKPAEPV